MSLSPPWTIVTLTFAITVAAQLSVPALGRLFGAAERLLARIARRPVVAAFTILLLAMTVGALPSMFLGRVPVPNVHDEFSYLLAGDTFARGRLTNPPHPMGKFLETFHVIQSPTYASKFPVGQGVALAAGQVICNLPIVGVWLSVSLECVAVWWALGAVTSQRWALLCGLMCAAYPVVNWWSQSYWGGNVAMLGGALLAGGALRALRRPTLASGLAIGAGLAILANSRPLEGMIVAVICGAYVLLTPLRRGSTRALLARAAPATIAVLAPTLAFMAYYNWCVTGHAATMPYVVHQKQYMIAPIFFWQSPNPMHEYAHDELRRFFAQHELDEFWRQRRLKSFPGAAWTKLKMLADHFLNPIALAIPVFVALLVRKNPRLTLSLVVCALLPLIHMLITPWLRVAYMAPAVGFWFVLIACGLRRLSTWRPPLGRAVAGATVVSVFVACAVYAGHIARLARAPLAVERAKLVERLSRTPGDHLVLVSYGQKHDPTIEWVFNGANIDQSRIVFARSIGDNANRELLEYFPHRRVWRLHLDGPKFDVQEIVR
jgi:hypothetical protein